MLSVTYTSPVVDPGETARPSMAGPIQDAGKMTTPATV
jgi:hypothetical protein